MGSRAHRLTAADVLRRYQDENMPEFLGTVLSDVNQAGHSGNSPLHLAATRGELDEVVALLEASANVDARGDLGDTPLHSAVAQGHAAVVSLLLAHGASLDARNERGMTPLAVAELLGKHDIATLLNR